MTVIGSSDLTVFPLALGANTFGWTSDEASSHEVLDAFVAGGGDLIDTADVYSAWVPGNTGGESESIIGRWMADRGNRSNVVVSTKVSQHPEFSGLSAANVAAAADASLARLATDYIDLYYAHYDDENTPLEETVAAFDALVTAGKIRYVGISNFSAERVSEWVGIARRNGFAAPVALQPHYNLVHRSDFEEHLAPVAERAQLGVLPYFGLASGFLTGKYRTAADLDQSSRGAGVKDYLTDEGLGVVSALATIADARGVAIASVALAWLLARPTVVAPIASARTRAQLPDLLEGARLELTEQEIALLDDASSGF
ncbi:aldo/keto reductase [Agreia sp. VKM Ac-1783]|jgi:aryl-alcohol dehydrogenase (NADP+)|uniref:aldo/keto reductase n=1 Tax=Agreia sp. VKM Ac-1783 TaxID=1938889 RepID=UPI000A2AC21F|nr:aldo/keto reductase [Agreia sp. VKM Ac-1783]SMQ59401.1 aryl-alcohol dehydrogenase (NADP+) [Agreia sp. VKM Ac-1783]